MSETPHRPRTAAETWAAARADYEAGDTVAVLSERYDVHERTIFRHASEEGWRRKGLDEISPGPRPFWDRRRTRRQSIDAEPVMGEINDARAPTR